MCRERGRKESEERDGGQRGRKGAADKADVEKAGNSIQYFHVP